MRNCYTFLAGLLAIVLSGSLTAQDGACPADLIHYWKFESNDTAFFRDYVGDLNGISVVDPTITAGKIGSSLYFNDTSQVNIPDNASFDWSNNSSFSFEFWLNKISECSSINPNNNNVIIGRDDVFNSKLHWWAGISCSNPGRLNFSLYSNDGFGHTLQSKRDVVDGNWHHVAIVRDGQLNSTSIYIDGSLDTTATFAFSDGFGSLVPINIGWLNRSVLYHYDGYLDELAVYNSAISELLINEHYTSSSAYCNTEDFDDDTTTADTLYNVSIMFTGMTPHIDQNLTVYIWQTGDINVIKSLVVSPVDSSEFTVVFDSLDNKSDYHLDFWADMNENNIYDAPPVDHAWRIELLDVDDDTTIVFEHNTNFTDIFNTGSDTTDVDTANYQLAVTFTGFNDNVGQDLIVYLREAENLDLVDSLTVTLIDSGDFTIIFDSVTVNESYNIDFYTDVNGNGSYDIPPVDQAWRIELANVDIDTTIIFVYDTNFTDIGLTVTGKDNLKENPGFTAFPNPVRDELTIYLEKGGRDIRIYNVAGALLIQKTITSNDRNVTLNVSSIKAGIYVLRVQTSSGIGYLKFLKE
jgi:hypothetical protein